MEVLAADIDNLKKDGMGDYLSVERMEEQMLR